MENTRKPIVEIISANASPDESSDARIIASVSDASPFDDANAPMLAATLHTLNEAQRAILNTQQANRDLIGVLVQDNFNLKAENERLRDRMLTLERDFAETRRREELRRESVEERLQVAEAAANALLAQMQQLEAQIHASMSAKLAPTSSKSFWARLLGD